MKTVTTVQSARCGSKLASANQTATLWRADGDPRQTEGDGWLDSEQSSPANDVSCCGCIHSEPLLVQIVSLMSFAELVPSTPVPSEQMDSEEMLAWIGMVLNTETFLNSRFSALGAQGNTLRNHRVGGAMNVIKAESFLPSSSSTSFVPTSSTCCDATEKDTKTECITEFLDSRVGRNQHSSSDGSSRHLQMASLASCLTHGRLRN